MEYNVEFTQTITVEADDADDAVEKALEEYNPDSPYIYVNGHCYN